MSSGSIDYWVTIDNWMYSLLTIVKDAVKQNGLIQVALDSMDGKLDGVIDLGGLTEAQTVHLAKMFLTDTVDGGGLNLLTKLDELDGVSDGVLDLNLLSTFDIFYDSVAGKSRLEVSIDKLILAITELTDIHTDTTSMVAFGSESWSGSGGTASWTLVASINDRRNMLRVTHTSGVRLDYSRNGSTTAGQIAYLGSTIFYDSPGVWVKGVGGTGYYDGYEEWAT
ncbi:hypothetical protein LCGC14_0771660 [marine sediment metagenome]|uniref:Uncharacterized protein n=1 Tax=marine sediment metagenome TaxID=412755 RepID=A0A0F9T4Z6_9ZZZZ